MSLPPTTRPAVVTAIAAVAIAAVLLIAPTGLGGVDLADLPMGEPEDVGMSSERLQRVDTAMQRYIDADQLAGTVTLIARHGKVVHLEAQGWRDKEAGQAMTADTIFTIMSMTKPIVSVALMMLYEEGHFLLDDPMRTCRSRFIRGTNGNTAPRPTTSRCSSRESPE